MLTCIEQYYKEKLLLNARLAGKYQLAILGMGAIGTALYADLSEEQSGQSCKQPVLQLDAGFDSDDKHLKPYQKNSDWLGTCERPLTVLVTPLSNHMSLLKQLRSSARHQFLGLQLADTEAGKSWLGQQTGDWLQLVRRFPDEVWLWQQYQNSVPDSQIHEVQAIRQVLCEAPVLS